MLIPNNSILTSDTHFGDKNIYKFAKDRKKIGKNKLIEEEIFNRIWKKDPSRTVVLLGDFILNGISNYLHFFKQKDISPTIFLPGNHDKSSFKSYKEVFGFNIVRGVYFNGKKLTHIKYSNYLYLNAVIQDIEGVRVMFSHFPVFDFSPYDRTKNFYKTIKKLEELYRTYNCELNMHGHTHYKNSNYNSSVNVCFDVDFQPFELNDIIKQFKIFKNQKIC